MAKTYAITAEKAREVLSYDPDTGLFTWLERRRRSDAGSQAGSVHTSGYRRIGVRGSLVYAHRLAWVMHHGREPEGEIDHLNGNRDDNRIANLRDVKPQLNKQNRRSSGLPGVKAANSGKWRAVIKFGGSTIASTGFDTEEEASALYLELKKRLHDGCSHW